MVVIDSDVIIWMLRGDKQITVQFKKTVVENEGNVFVTPVQIAEIFAGILPGEKSRVEEFFGALGVFTIDERAGRLAGDFINRFGKSHNVTMADALIAAVSSLNNCTLWTRNRKHYPMLQRDRFYEA